VRLVRAVYYTPFLEKYQDYTSVRALAKSLSHNGFTVVIEEAPRDAAVRRMKKVSLGLELAVDTMDWPNSWMRWFSGDVNFRSLIAAVRRVRVDVVSTVGTRLAMIADDLLRQADAFINLDDLRGSLGRTARASGTGIRTPHCRADPRSPGD
jgi:uncharacterized LabA/DUF88 family protein